MATNTSLDTEQTTQAQTDVSEPSEQALQKYRDLLDYLAQQGSLAVAFSGGVDSTFLLKCAKEALGKNVIAVTAKSLSFPERERREAQEFCRHEGIRHFVVESEELKIPGFSHNPTNRCYLCKSELFHEIRQLADREGMAQVAEGSNMDDNGDYRPGLKAVAEQGILSPLRHAGLYKSEIRSISRQMGLPTWNKQSFACLSSRFAYGESITPKKLGMVDRAEQELLDLGFHQVRVRIHGDSLARIEVLPAEFPQLLDNAQRLVRDFKALGFSYVTMDLAGYRTGSMNETLEGDDAK